MVCFVIVKGEDCVGSLWEERTGWSWSYEQGICVCAWNCLQSYFTLLHMYNVYIYIYSNYVRHTYPLIDLDIACGESLD